MAKAPSPVTTSREKLCVCVWGGEHGLQTTQQESYFSVCLDGDMLLAMFVAKQS